MCDDRIAALESRIASLEQGISALLERVPPVVGGADPAAVGDDGAAVRPSASSGVAAAPAADAPAPPAPPPAEAPVPHAPPPADDALWALNGLTERLPSPGAVMLVGAVDLPDGRVARWQEGRTTDALLADDWEDVADALAALAHPVRLRLLRTLADGARTARELTELEGMGTSGQVYHHLRQLVAAGWLSSRSGGRFEIPPERVVPLLTTVLGGRR